MAEYPITNICQINQPWEQHDSKDSDVDQDSGLLERDSVTSSNNSVQYTAGPLMKNAQYSCETSATTNPPTKCHIPEHVNHQYNRHSLGSLYNAELLAHISSTTAVEMWLYADDMCVSYIKAIRCKYLTMICSKHINYVQVIPERLLILLCPKDRPHTALLGPQPVQIFLRQEQMVWTHLACHRQTLTHTHTHTKQQYSRQNNLFHRILLIRKCCA